MLHCGPYRLKLDRPLIMGIVNLTPDSFSGDGIAADTARAIAHARQQLAAGADILDLGAESSRPGAIPTPLDEELERLLPVLDALGDCAVPISVDTRNLSNSKHPVTKLEDIKGLKVRVMANPVALETWKILEANAVPMAFSEVFTALEIKAIDGQENPLIHMYANKMQEVQKFISLTNHVYTTVAIVASKKFWDGLSDADKQGLQKAATEAGLLQRQLLDEGDKEVVAKFEKAGVKVNAVSAEELKRIQDKLKPVTAKFAPQIGEDFLKEFNAEIEKARAAK